MGKKNQIDMTTGSIIGKQIRFIIPLICTGMLQLLYNAVDVIVVGRFAGTTALSAVGSTGSLTNLIINVFIGLSVGINVVTAMYYGKKDDDNMQKTIHTAISLGIIGGLILAVFSFLAAPGLLRLMSTPDDVIDQAILYMRIIFIGMPFNLVYNFSAAILRAVGDTKRPLRYLGISGIVNVILNLIFVIIFHMDVAGVALATIIAQCMSMILITRCLMKSEGALQLSIKKLCIHKEQAIRIIKIGVPSGIQSSCFSLSNVLLQSSINGFGSIAMAGNAASSSLEGFLYVTTNSVQQSAITFVGQNRGAKQHDRVRKNLFYASGLVVLIALTVATFFNVFNTELIGLYTSDVDAIAIGIQRLGMYSTFYFFFGLMDVTSGMLRGMGYSMGPMVISLLGVCGFRIVWIFGVFAAFPSLQVLYYSYPISWILTWSILIIYYRIVIRKELCIIGDK
ncbi:MAG: MATE family efflux transporter [Eubacteriales bacterium]